MHLDDLAERLGTRVSAIRDALGGEPDLAVALAHDLRDGDDYVLVATRTGVHVRYLWPEEQHPLLSQVSPGHVGWTSVRVSPLRTEGWKVAGREDPALATHSCEVRVAGVAFLIAGNGTTGLQAIAGFHDEVIRRGTPWHHPSAGH